MGGSSNPIPKKIQTAADPFSTAVNTLGGGGGDQQQGGQGASEPQPIAAISPIPTAPANQDVKKRGPTLGILEDAKRRRRAGGARQSTVLNASLDDKLG